ncbi:MAG: CCA tRNA nucleotidyltransferase [Endomicrobium sp.]|jgi:tRNA nucleotidyltransferase/poly(A) polymerase|nr:CCA tRNA nucleotidyltransferase [Endomicrobium sp.]
MNGIKIPKQFAGIIDKISDTAGESNFEAYAVGGFVRDLFLDRQPKDLDIMVEDKKNADNDFAGIEFSKLLAKKYDLREPVIFERFGTAKLFIDDEEVEFIMPRKEYYDDNSRNPDTEIGSLQQDALRRDFTVNALFLRLSDMELLDLTANGIADIKKKIIRVTDLQNAEIIFAQDPLRILRAIRQKLQLGFDIEEITFEAMKNSSSRISIVAPERIRDEINKILVENDPSSAFRIMKETGLLAEIFPEIERLDGLKQPSKYHDNHVLDHTYKVLDRTNTDLILRMSALLHDTGKFCAFKQEGEKISFHGHESYSAEIADKILKRLHYPKEFSAKVVNVIKNHMYPKHYSPQWKDGAIRRFAGACGDDIDYVLELSLADYGKERPDGKIFELIERINILKKKNLLYPQDELLSGAELMQYFGLTGGEWIKKAKERILSARLDDPKITKDEALFIVKEMLKKSSQ